MLEAICFGKSENAKKKKKPKTSIEKYCLIPIPVGPTLLIYLLFSVQGAYFYVVENC